MALAAAAPPAVPAVIARVLSGWALLLALSAPVAHSQGSDVALERMESQLVRESARAEHWSAYGRALSERARYRDAVAAHQRAIMLGVADRSAEARVVAEAFALAGDLKQAARWVEQATLFSQVVKPATGSSRLGEHGNNRKI